MSVCVRSVHAAGWKLGISVFAACEVLVVREQRVFLAGLAIIISEDYQVSEAPDGVCVGPGTDHSRALPPVRSTRGC